MLPPGTATDLFLSPPSFSLQANQTLQCWVAQATPLVCLSSRGSRPTFASTFSRCPHPLPICFCKTQDPHRRVRSLLSGLFPQLVVGRLDLERLRPRAYAEVAGKEAVKTTLPLFDSSGCSPHNTHCCPWPMFELELSLSGAVAVVFLCFVTPPSPPF